MIKLSEKKRQEKNARNKEFWRSRPKWYKAYIYGTWRCNHKSCNIYKYYGGKGIQFLLTREDVHFLWDRDKANLMVKPSLHRKDNNRNYTLSNCEFIEHTENNRLGHLGNQYRKGKKFSKEAIKKMSEARTKWWKNQIIDKLEKEGR